MSAHTNEHSVAAPSSPSVRSRAQAAGMSPARIEKHFANRRILLDGQIVNDLDQPAPDGSAIYIAGD